MCQFTEQNCILLSKNSSFSSLQGPTSFHCSIPYLAAPLQIKVYLMYNKLSLKNEWTPYYHLLGNAPTKDILCLVKWRTSVCWTSIRWNLKIARENNMPSFKQVSYKNCLIGLIHIFFSLPQGFYMDENEINRRLPKDMQELSDSFEMKTIAIWITDNTTEIYYCEAEPCDETLVRIDQLSQSFLG